MYVDVDVHAILIKYGKSTYDIYRSTMTHGIIETTFSTYIFPAFNGLYTVHTNVWPI